jgi:hypothetical protein
MRLIIILFLGLIFGCKKEGNLLLDKDWLLVDGKIYMENLESGKKTFFDHFAPGKTNSSINIDGGVTETDSIFQNRTVWYFSKSAFILNGIQTFQATYNDNNVIRVFPMRNGSAMIVQLQKLTKEELTVKVGEAYESINGENVHYFSILKFSSI